MSVQTNDVLYELAAREPIFHRPQITTEDEIDAITTDDFWEVGASGRVYDRQFVTHELIRRHEQKVPPGTFETSDFACRQLGPETWLLTYHLIQNAERQTRRATIWRRTSAGWQAMYHQGTLIAT